MTKKRNLRDIEKKALDRELFGTRKAAQVAKAAAAQAATPAAGEAIINAAIAAASEVMAAAAAARDATRAVSAATTTAGALDQQDRITSQEHRQQSYDYNLKKLSIVPAEPIEKSTGEETSDN